VSKKNSNLFEWLNLIVMEGLPFIMVESKHLRKISKLDCISVESLMIFLGEMTRFVIFLLNRVVYLLESSRMKFAGFCPKYLR
jgi:hypothetical protein